MQNLRDDGDGGDAARVQGLDVLSRHALAGLDEWDAGRVGDDGLGAGAPLSRTHCHLLRSSASVTLLSLVTWDAPLLICTCLCARRQRGRGRG